MVDWTVARLVAQRVAGDTEPVMLGELAGAAAESEQRVAAYTRLSAASVPPPEAVDRDAWTAANLRGLKTVMEPITEKLGDGLGPLAGPARAAAGLVLGAEIGAVSGMLSQRVLGQYEFPLLDPAAPARLLYLAPNLAQAASALRADREDVVRWVALHETTHALQFGGVPWLREHLAGLVRELLSEMGVSFNPRALARIPDGGDVRALLDRVRRDGVVALVVTPAQRDLLDRVQSLMAVLEGHAEHVMDAVGAEVLPSLPELRAGLERRRVNRPVVWRILERVLGLEMKMRQYREGKAFCDAVVAHAGIEGLNLVWEGPGRLPSGPELLDPESWLRRVSPIVA